MLLFSMLLHSSRTDFPFGSQRPYHTGLRNLNESMGAAHFSRYPRTRTFAQRLARATSLLKTDFIHAIRTSRNRSRQTSNSSRCPSLRTNMRLLLAERAWRKAIFVSALADPWPEIPFAEATRYLTAVSMNLLATTPGAYRLQISGCALSR